MLSRYVVSQVKHNSFFLVGLALGLWVSLLLVPLEEESECVRTAPAESAVGAGDEWEPQREERPLGAGAPPARVLQRPRYYSTELGMRAPLLAGVLSSEEALDTRAAAINETAAGLLPALRFFISASSLQLKPGRANVVGFTDTREMLKPFHALKYLADNYLEDYNFFFLVTDTSYINARQLNELVSKLSVSQDVYMGAVAEDDTHYCTLEGGILLSNSVLRAVHGELDWCVRNSYSPHHHENIGRCVLHAAHTPCSASLHAANYSAAVLATDAVSDSLPDAVTAHPVTDPAHFHRLHALVSRVRLQRAHDRVGDERTLAAASFRRHPRGFRNATWPPALRADAGLASPPPPTRFDHLRWTRFNATHAFMPDDERAVAALGGATLEAVRLVVREGLAWARRHWDADAELDEGAWCWDPPHALRYRLLVRLSANDRRAVRQLEAVRPLGAARLAPARYVTETARVTLVAPAAAPPKLAAEALGLLRRYEASLDRDSNTALALVAVGASADDLAALRESIRALVERRRDARVQLFESPPPDKESAGAGEPEWREVAARLALEVAAPHFARDALLLLIPGDAEFSEDFLNRARMNTIAGEQWYMPSAFARFAHYTHPRWREADGSRPTVNTGRFERSPLALAVSRGDYSDAREAWLARGGDPRAGPARLLAASSLRCIRAPEPALVRAAAGPPCDLADSATCLRRERSRGFGRLHLGARHTLAKLLLSERALLSAD
ncbi:chondroitin sulfate synthase 2 [Pieris brassicae]|uniref:chondroitin sulfate synthase 2 n=1 Tax=Pieris brassicae TaxID=7116 RepID=UPI001E65E730|nr:chondroitin sulfate synthase 2 [Pieris brassicae]